jgi:hypothetical protein
MVKHEEESAVLSQKFGGGPHGIGNIENIVNHSLKALIS